MKKLLGILPVAALAACASGDPVVVPRPHATVARAGILGGAAPPPPERDGVRREDTGAIMFVCSGSDRHEDKEVFITRCAGCGAENYFYRDHAADAFRCYVCLKAVEESGVACPECGRPPRTWRTRPKPKSA
jgi:DNA-directed RNA polymerase subunit RPC12/RpoP